MSAAKHLLSRSAAIVAMRVAGAAVMLAVQALIARRLGSHELGAYTQASSAINIAATALPLGFQIIASYFAADYAARAQGLMLRRFFIQAQLQVLATALAVYDAGALLFATSGTAPVAVYWPQICLFATACASVFVSGATLAALRRPVLAFLGDGLMRPAIMALACLVALAAAAPGMELAHMFWIAALGHAGVALAYLFGAADAVAKTAKGDAVLASEQRRWWRFALPWTLIALATDYFFDVQTLLLSGLLTYAELAVFGAVVKIFALAAFGVAVIYNVTLPDIFEAGAANDHRGLAGTVFRANASAAAFSALGLVAALVASPLVLGLFGQDFAAGRIPLAILCVGLLIRSVFGPAALLLSMHDRPYAALPAAGLGLAVMVVASQALVPAYGLKGAAASSVAAIALWSALTWWTARRLTGVDVSLAAPLFSARRKAIAASAGRGS